MTLLSAFLIGCLTFSRVKELGTKLKASRVDWGTLALDGSPTSHSRKTPKSSTGWGAGWKKQESQAQLIFVFLLSIFVFMYLF